MNGSPEGKERENHFFILVDMTMRLIAARVFTLVVRWNGMFIESSFQRLHSQNRLHSENTRILF